MTVKNASLICKKFPISIRSHVGFENRSSIPCDTILVRWRLFPSRKLQANVHRQPAPTTRRWPNVALMLGRRRRRRANIKAILGQCLVFAGKAATKIQHWRLKWKCGKKWWIKSQILYSEISADGFDYIIAFSAVNIPDHSSLNNYWWNHSYCMQILSARVIPVLHAITLAVNTDVPVNTKHLYNIYTMYVPCFSLLIYQTNMSISV